MMDLLWMTLQEAFWSGCATAGFAVLFNVPRRALLYCILAGAVGRAVRTLLIEGFDVGVVAATLAGATLVGFLAHYMAIRLKMPSLIFGICGAIPMVPGVFAFQTMLALVQITGLPQEAVADKLVSAAQNGILTGLILGALAAGIVMPSLLFDRPKPVV